MSVYLHALRHGFVTLALLRVRSAARGQGRAALSRDAAGRPIHALWGTSVAEPNMATLVTAYRPDPMRWSPDFLRRKPK